MGPMVYWPRWGSRASVEAERATLPVLMIDDEDRTARLDLAARSVIVPDRRPEALIAPRSDLAATLHGEGPRPMTYVPRSVSPGQAPAPASSNPAASSCTSYGPRFERGAEAK